MDGTALASLLQLAAATNLLLWRIRGPAGAFAMRIIVLPPAMSRYIGRRFGSLA